MKTYAKGSRAEREILHYLNHKGFSCVRVPSSGGFISPLDVLAIKKGLILAFEIKNHKTKPRLNKKQLSSFSEWCRRAGALGFVAWRRTTPPNLTASERWLFLRINDAEQGNYEDDNWIERNMLLNALDI